MSEMLCDEKHIFEARRLRDSAAGTLLPDDWGSSETIAKLVGCPNTDGSFMVENYTTGSGRVMARGVSRTSLELLRALNGPHAYAVYRMLLLKKNNLQE
jgi:hypothetical protein